VRYDAGRDGDPVSYTRRILQEFSPAPLPPQRNDGYCIQVSGGPNANAAFTAQ